MKRVALLVTLLACLLGAGGGIAGAAEPKTTLHDVESEVMCVSCGVPLSIAESPQADAERRAITDMIRQGKTKDQILDALVVQYGDRVLASPKDEGFGLAAYLVPIVLVALALLAGALVLPKWRARAREREARPAVAGAGGAPLSDADTRRLEEDLARYDV